MIYRRGLKRIVILKARQIGFSTLLGVICADQLCWNTGKQISLVDKTQEDARQKLKNITVLAYDSLHPEFKDRFVVSRANSGEFGVRFFEYEAARPPQCLPAPMPEEVQIFSFGYRNGVSSRRRISGALRNLQRGQFGRCLRVRWHSAPGRLHCRMRHSLSILGIRRHYLGLRSWQG